ncbi:MAG: hypothetical protein KGQ93_01455 [Cyanobacteria bacterium REEB459]|nr:hypothetical protein [Cyanobacteria bacterium REEB459]
MQLDWPMQRLNRWSRRLLRMWLFAIATFFTVTSLMLPVYSGEPNTAADSILYFKTPNYTVSVFPRSAPGQKMNVYRQGYPARSEALNSPAYFRGAIGSDGWVSYDAYGSRDGRNVIFRASANRSTYQARLEILDGANNSIVLTENATSITTIATPETGDNGTVQLKDTIILFETQNYSVRVYRERNSALKKVNVYNKASQQQVVNGQPATPALNVPPPYDCWVSYFGGSQYNGASAQYFIRVSSSGEAKVEAIGANGSVLMSEPRISAFPLTTNIPAEDRPQCFGSGDPSSNPSGGGLAPFIAGVFGDQSVLNAVKQQLNSFGPGRGLGGTTCVVSPRFENASQGQFINAAECESRDDAGSVVNYLRGRGFNARLIYRNFRYR